MLGLIIHTLDGIARFIGWGAMILGALWLVGQLLADKQRTKEAMADREAKIRFDYYLEKENPDSYYKYTEIQRDCGFSGERIHWHAAAQKAGVPTSEILRTRDPLPRD